MYFQGLHKGWNSITLSHLSPLKCLIEGIESSSVFNGFFASVFTKSVDFDQMAYTNAVLSLIPPNSYAHAVSLTSMNYISVLNVYKSMTFQT